MYNRLAYTGGATVAFGGVVLDQLQVALIAVGMIVVGAALVRFAWRRGKTVSDR
jgi:hypothetical protein